MPSLHAEDERAQSALVMGGLTYHLVRLPQVEVRSPGGMLPKRIKVAFSPNADPGNELAVLKFHRLGHQHEATAALHEVLDNLASGEATDTAGRILVIAGQAGTGKTHLVVNELRSVPASVTPIVIFSPDRWKEFDPWLDEQVVTSLLQTRDDKQSVDALTSLSTMLIAAAFGQSPQNLAGDSRSG